MTIEEYKMVVGWDYREKSDHIVICTWFDHDGKLQTREFEQDALKLSADENEE